MEWANEMIKAELLSFVADDFRQNKGMGPTHSF